MGSNAKDPEGSSESFEGKEIMAYYRVTLDNYIEGEYISPEEAIEDFVQVIKDDLRYLACVEIFNEENNEWESA